MEENGIDTIEVYGKTIDLENELKEKLKKKNPFDKEVINIRNSIKNNYVEILFGNYDFASSKEIEQNLWKNIFYKMIEEYRKRIRKYVTLIKNKQEKPSTKEELQKVADSFRGFLKQTTKFYLDLIDRFQKTFHLKLDGSAEVTQMHKSYQSCHRCFIFLGDLARYHQDLHGHPSRKDWLKAPKYYIKALQLLPDNGNPHNQLAVFYSYRNEFLIAVYHYYRSLAVKQPFLTAKDNLAVLFQKNKLLEPSTKSLDSFDSSEDEHPDRTQTTLFETFSNNFIRLHGILFTKTDFEEFQLDPTLNQFQTLLKNKEITDEMVLKIFTINIFSLFSTNWTPEGTLTYSEVSQRPQLIRLALPLSFSFFIEVIRASIHSSANEFLASISVFLDFLFCNQEWLKTPTDPKIISCWENTWDELAALLNILVETEDIDSEENPLPEEIDLCGYLPLNPVYRSLPRNKTEQKKNLLKTIRAKKIKNFALRLCNKSEEPKLLYYDREGGRFSHQPYQKFTSSNGLSDNQSQENTRGVSSQALVDFIEDEVILFKPGDGIKYETDSSENSHPQSVIGSGRIEPKPTNPYSGFNLFGTNNEENNSLFSTSILGQSNQTSLEYKYFGAPTEPGYNYPTNQPNYFGQGGPSFWSPVSSNSFFNSSTNQSFDKPIMGWLPQIAAQQNKTPSHFEESMLPSPFPGTPSSPQSHSTPKNPFLP